MKMPAENPELGAHPDIAKRIHDALVEIVGTQGYSKMTPEAVLDRAGVDRAAFERRYPSFEGCIAETWLEIMAREFWPRSDAAFRKGAIWREGMRLQAWDLLRFIEEDIARTRFLMEAGAQEEAVQGHRDQAMSRFTDYVHLGRFERREGPEVPRATAEALVGAIWNGIAQNTKADPDFEALREGPPQILYLTMLAYLGEDEAQEELRRGSEDLARYERGEL